MRRTDQTTSVVLAILVAFALLAGCTAKGGNQTPTPVTDSPERAAADLADGLSAADLSHVEFDGASSADVDRQFRAIVAGMGPVRPEVGVASMNAQATAATATLRFTWTFPGVPTTWVYDTTAGMTRQADRWKTTWTPTIVQPGLDGTNRLSQHRLYAARGEVLGEDGDPIVKLRPVVRIGLDKTGVAADRTEASARRLAQLVGIDAKSYIVKVAAAGPKAFVEAIVYRSTDKSRPSNASVAAVPGALAIEGEQMLGPSASFARAVLGTVGDATKEVVDGSDGAVVAGDQVGLSGLERRYDAQLRGTPGAVVQFVAAKPGGSGPSPSPSATPTPGPSQILFQTTPVAGKDLRITLNVGMQKLAERILADTKPPSAIVAIRPSTGAVLTVANGPGTAGQSVATVGQFAPGSTFKVATTLALLRAGLSPDSVVNCPAKINVDGRQFENYDDYPRDELGRITLRTALAQSCNTAFIGQTAKLTDGALAEAAGTLGLGIDYDVGFPAYFGSVRTDDTQTGRAAAMIGQSTVQVSPLAMAAVASSVMAGRTVVPHLVSGRVTKPTAKPMTAQEARQLRSMMQSVVLLGSGRFLSEIDGDPVIAKTGTAEYGTRTPPRTHAWMIAAQGDLAVAVFVADGQSGSRTAGPLLEKFLVGNL